MNEDDKEKPPTPAPAPAPGTENPPTPAPPAPAAPPPAAKAVTEGKTERELQLEKDLKKAQTEASEKEDQLSQLKKLHPSPAKKKKSGIRWTLLHRADEED